MKASYSEFVELGGQRYHVRRWGNPQAPTLFMLHGWMDISATFQFVVDALAREWNIIAPDWPGFGLSAWSPGGYSLLQYTTDLDRLLDHYSPHAAVPIVAHSMGANISNIYISARPQRVSHFVNIEGYAPVPEFFEGSLGQVVGRWLDHIAKPGQGRPYADYARLCERLQQSNKRLPPERAKFLASQLGVMGDDGLVHIAADPLTRFFAPISLHREQLIELWRGMSLPVLCIRGGRSFISKAFEHRQEDLQERIAALPQGREALLEDGTHNLHHEHPEQVAQLIEALLEQ
ncbi:alpha/beta fold hydrolase [Pseudomonas lopnurensis]|uniref:alpha/beta fold hydrolase n=1 Tax=Pseudomonas lopnurensis TaxID=1477517 RepID=UPI0028A708D5|nr:alpha/beta hydrolase [Pseudomonas lopnurensis]